MYVQVSQEDAEDKTVKEEKDAAEEDESDKKETEEKPKEAEGVDVKGIPSFWLTAMKNVELLEPLIRVCTYVWDCGHITHMYDTCLRTGLYVHRLVHVHNNMQTIMTDHLQLHITTCTYSNTV